MSWGCVAGEVGMGDLGDLPRNKEALDGDDGFDVHSHGPGTGITGTGTEGTNFGRTGGAARRRSPAASGAST